MKTITRIVISAAALLLTAAVTYLSTYNLLYEQMQEKVDATEAAYREQYGAFSKLIEAAEVFSGTYVKSGELNEEKLVEWAIAGYLAGTGDKYADYLSAEDVAELFTSKAGESEGIGIRVTYNDEQGAIQVISVIDGGPAAEAGIAVGDLIVAIGRADGGSVTYVSELGYDMALKRLQGAAGTVAEFTVYREGDLLSFSVERAKVTSDSVEGHVYGFDGTVGVVRIVNFDSTTPVQLKAVVARLKEAGCTRFVMDLRNNGGGYLDSIGAVLDDLLPEGVVARSIDSAGKEEVLLTSDAEQDRFPMAILVNGNTASAAELFTSAMKDYTEKGLADAVIVGTKTYGKGVMQTYRFLSDGSAIKVTDAYYCPPFSDNYDGVGIVPDVLSELPADVKNMYLLNDETDPQLHDAVAALDARFSN